MVGGVCSEGERWQGGLGNGILGVQLVVGLSRRVTDIGGTRSFQPRLRTQRRRVTGHVRMVVSSAPIRHEITVVFQHVEVIVLHQTPQRPGTLGPRRRVADIDGDAPKVFGAYNPGQRRE